MQTTKLISLLALISLALQACQPHSTTTSTPDPTPTSTLPDTLPTDRDSLKQIILQQLHSNTLSYQNYSCKINLDLNTDAAINSFTANTRMIKDSAIWVSISPALGIEAARLYITPDSVYMIDRIKKTALIQPYSYVTQLGIPFDFHTLQEAIVGNPIYLFQTKQKVFVEKGQPLLMTQHDTITSTFTISTTHSHLQAITIIDNRNNQSVTYTFTQYSEPIQLASQSHTPATQRSIRYLKDQKDLQVELEIKNIKIDESALQLPFSIPDGYEIKR